MRPALFRDRDAMLQRALAYWHSADADVRRAGLSWYRVIADRASALAPELPRETVIGAMAVLSPRITVAQNLYDLETVLTGRPYVTSAFPRNVERARAILAGTPFDDVVGPAPKTRAFRLNLLGETAPVTVDTWMVTVLLGLERGERDGQHGSLTRRQYDVLADVLREGARIAGVSPRTFQATVWIAARKAVA